MEATSFERIIARAAVQHGYISARDVTALGLDPVMLRKAAAKGRVVRVAQGLYRVPAVPVGPLDRFARASHWAAGRGIISHRAALAVLGVGPASTWARARASAPGAGSLRAGQPKRGVETIELTVPPAYVPRRAGGEQYRVFRHRLTRAEVTDVEGLAVTTAERTLIDLHRLGAPPAELIALIFGAVAAGRLSQPRSTWLTRLVRGELVEPHPDW